VGGAHPTEQPIKHDTDIGGPRGAFPETHHSAVIAAGSDDAGVRERGFDALIGGYWKPVYKYLRLKWKLDNEQAKDATQGFFATAMEKGWFARYEPDKAAFRTFLRTCLDGYVSNERRAARRLKRGGGRAVLSLDFDAAESEFRAQPAAATPSVDEYFEREWVRSMFGLAVESLRAWCERNDKSVHYRLFEAYDLNRQDAARPSYAELGERFDLPVTQVTNYLSLVRRQFRALVLDALREMTGSQAEFRAEVRALLGVDAE
jgi:DNA-directed RNA polymerase specialized sigma24 family protein